MGYDLWPKPYRLRSFAGGLMRISDDVRRCVVFIGRSLGPPDNKFEAMGTAFFVEYKKHAYLVTVQHIAAQIGDLPFEIRINKTDGTSESFTIDPLESDFTWYFHKDDTVDLAVLSLIWNLPPANFDCKLIPYHMFVDAENANDSWIGIGDICYAVGLFRLMSGTTKNLPVVHTGNIALMPSDERIPVKDWHNPSPRAPSKKVEGYLVELQNLQGLSGAPVFVRPGLNVGKAAMNSGTVVGLRSAQSNVLLLGVWQASWDAEQDEVMAVEQGKPVRVPVGMGTVVPVNKLTEILELPEVQADREEHAAQILKAQSASPDVQ